MGKKKTPNQEDITISADFDAEEFDDFHIDYEDEKRHLTSQRRRERSERRRSRFTYNTPEFDVD